MSSSLKMLGKENYTVNGNALKEINTNIQKLSLKEDVKAKVTYERVTCFGGKGDFAGSSLFRICEKCWFRAVNLIW